MTSQKKVRLIDIAKNTGYSVSTVAKVLSGKAKETRISDNTANSIIMAANRLGYVPNIMARNLRSKRSGMIGIHLAAATDAIIMETLTAILQTLPERGYLPILTVEETDAERCFDTWKRSELEGIIFCGPSEMITSDILRKLSERNIAVVIAGNPLHTDTTSATSNDRIPIVQIDNRLGIHYAVEHLLATGKKHIAHLAGPDSHSDASERMTSYIDIITPHHKPIIADIDSSELFWQRGYHAATQLLENKSRIDAVIAYDDNVALGAMKCFSDMGKAIPDDIAVIGFDNQPQAEYAIPSLTTLDQPSDILGRTSLEVLESVITGTYDGTRRILIEPSLIVRESTAGIDT